MFFKYIYTQKNDPLSLLTRIKDTDAMALVTPHLAPCAETRTQENVLEKKMSKYTLFDRNVVRLITEFATNSVMVTWLDKQLVATKPQQVAILASTMGVISLKSKEGRCETCSALYGSWFDAYPMNSIHIGTTWTHITCRLCNKKFCQGCWLQHDY